MAAWILVPTLADLRSELNELAPARDKASDGTIGDQAHASGASSHNPDRTGTPEWRDGDALNEVRAIDLDKDLRHPHVTMAKVVRHLVTGARSGRFWWLRYIIFDGIIYHRRYAFAARTYTGSNKHDKHAHINSEFSQKADSYTDATYGLDELLPPPPPPPTTGKAPTMDEIKAYFESAARAARGDATATSADRAARNNLKAIILYSLGINYADQADSANLPKGRWDSIDTVTEKTHNDVVTILDAVTGDTPPPPAPAA